MLFMQAVEAPIVTVPYKGTGPAMTELLGGQIDIMCDQSTNTAEQIKGGTIEAYAVTSPARLDIFPDLPTVAEAGLPGVEVSIWHGIYAPKGTPAPVLKKLSDAVRAAVKDPEFIKKQELGGASVVTDSRVDPAGHKAFVMAEMAKWAPVIKAGGIYAD